MSRTAAAGLVVALVLAGTAPELATPMCYGAKSGVTYGFGFTLGDDYTEDEQSQFDLMRLRRAGVDTDRVERWNGCLRAFVEGGMRFFDPETLEEVF
jgi:hypothetical protein